MTPSGFYIMLRMKCRIDPFCYGQKLYEEVFVGMKAIIDPDDPQKTAMDEQPEQPE